jgi:hypothetical protein
MAKIAPIIPNIIFGAFFFLGWVVFSIFFRFKGKPS